MKNNMLKLSLFVFAATVAGSAVAGITITEFVDEWNAFNKDEILNRTFMNDQKLELISDKFDTLKLKLKETKSDKYNYRKLNVQILGTGVPHIKKWKEIIFDDNVQCKALLILKKERVINKQGVTVEKMVPQLEFAGGTKSMCEYREGKYRKPPGKGKPRKGRPRR